MFLLGSVGWAMAQEEIKNDPPQPFTKQEITQTDLYAALAESSRPAIGIFANGHPVEITEKDGEVYVTATDVKNAVPYKLETPQKTIVFGGWYDDDDSSSDHSAATTSVTMTSGEIWSIVGGSYGTSSEYKKAVGTTNINLNGGTVTGYVVGGGALYSETTTANITSIANSTVTVESWIIGCMESGAITEGNAYSDYNQSPCKVGTLNWDLQGGTFTYIGLSGGNGSRTFTNNVSGRISKSTIVGGLFGCGSNGQGGWVSVTIDGCTFSKTGEDRIEIAAVNRGKVATVNLNFWNCTFGNDENDYHAYAGTTYNWTNDGKQASDKHSVTSSVSWDFSQCKNVPFALGLGDGLDCDLVVSGIPVEVAPFVKNNGVTKETITSFTVPENKKWFLHGGLHYAAGEPATLTNNGSLEVRVSKADQLAAAVEAGADEVTLEEGEYVLSEQLVINKAMTLEGSLAANGLDPATTIKANTTISWPTKDNGQGQQVSDNSKRNLISIVAGSEANVSLKHIRVQESMAAGINVQTAKQVTLENVACENNLTAGLLVHAPVVATNFHTSYNGWGGVNIDNGKNGGDPNIYNPTFQFDARSTFDENANQIWSELADKKANEIVTLPEGNTTWRAIKGKSDDGQKDMWFWTNQKLTQETVGGITYVYANGNPVTVTAKESDDSKIIIATTGESIETTGSSTVLYGGSKNAPVETTSITINSGNIKTVFGGGYGETSDSFANVTTANIAVHGGEVAYLMVGGGKYYAKTGTVNITMDNENAIIDEIYAGGYDAGVTGNTITTPLDQSNNGVNNVNITLTAGTMHSAIGLGGGQGYTRTGKSIIRVSNVTLGGIYGTDSNGHADDVDAVFTNCTFKDGSKEIASTNRGMIDKANLVFDNCTFANDIDAYIGAVSGWANSDTNGTPTPEVTESISYEFKNCQGVPTVKIGEGLTNANVTVTGAPVRIEKFYRGSKLAESNQYLAAFEIAAGKTWTFNNGLTFSTGDNIATLTNSGTLIVKGVTDAADLKALVTSKANEITTTLQANDVSAAFGTMESLPKNMVIYAADKAVYMTESEATTVASTTGKATAYLVKTDSGYELKEVNAPTTPPVITDEHKPSIVGEPEAGKTLSAYALTGGTATVNNAEIAGSFTWVNPDATLNAGEHEYEVVFTPVDLSLYSTVKTSIKINAIQYYTVTAGTCENGKVIIENASAANKYKAGETLTLRAEADPHYIFKQWGEGITGTTYNVTADKELTATFEAITHEVTVPSSVEGGTLSVLNNGVAISSPVPEGTILTVVATPAEDKELDALTYQIGNTTYPIRNGQVEVSAVMTISASFKAKANHLLKVENTTNGKILLFDANGNAINMGTSVTTGTKLTVVAVPDKGYTAGSIAVTGATPNGSYYEVGNSDVTFSATFTQATYTITKDSNVELNQIRGSGNGSSYYYGDVIKATATPTEGKKLISLLVNGKEMANEGQFTVTDNMTITVNEVALTTIQIDEAQQTYVYDGEAKKFAIRSTPMGLTGFTVTYQKNEEAASTEAPTNAGTYKVTITRDADDSFAAFNQPIEAGLVIEQAELKGVGAPTWDNTNRKWTGSSLGTWTEESEQTGDIVKVKFTPTNTNFKSVTFEGIKDASSLTRVEMPSSGLRSSTLRAGTTASLSINATNGAVSLWNGTEKITSTSTVYVGQTLTVKGLPDAGYSSKATWKINNEDKAPGVSTTITLGSGANYITVNFPAKTSITPLPSVNNSAATPYTGSVILPSITTGTISNGWTYVIKAGGVVVDHPTDADTYSVYASRSEDEQYMAVDNQFIGSYTISQQTITTGVSVTSASPILKGQTLAQSTLTGTAPVAGTFAWASPTTVPADESTDYAVIFTPNDTKNYEVASSVSLKQKVSFYTGSRNATARVITFAPAENGTFVVKVNGVAVETGAQVSAGDQVVVETTPNSGYSASVSYTGITNGVVDATDNVTVTVTFTRNSTPITPGEGGGGSDPDPVIPTVSNPVVAERTATTAAVTWEKVSGATSYKLFLYAKKTDSTPLKTYEFDKDGKLKATAISFTLTGLEEGKAYYVETAAYNASGTLLVKKSVELSATPTGIEAISEGSQLYTVKGAIVVAPTEPLQVAIYSVTGQTLFNDEVSYLTQVPAQAGIYVVVIQKGKERITEKVIVK